MNQAITVNQLHPILHNLDPSSVIKQALMEMELIPPRRGPNP